MTNFAFFSVKNLPKMELLNDKVETPRELHSFKNSKPTFSNIFPSIFDIQMLGEQFAGKQKSKYKMCPFSLFYIISST